MIRTRISPRPSPSERQRRRGRGAIAATIAAGVGAMVLAASVLSGCAGAGDGGAQSANGITMYGTIDQGVSFRSR